MAKLVLGGDNNSATPAFITIQEKEVPTKKFGLSLDSFVGSVDENGVYRESLDSFAFDGTGIVTLEGKLNFSGDDRLLAVNLKDLIEFKERQYSAQAFMECYNLTEVNLDSLTRIYSDYIYGGAASYMFTNTGIREIKMNNLTNISNSQSASYMFHNCFALDTVELSNLETIEGDWAANNMFSYCPTTYVYMPKIRSISGHCACYGMFECSIMSSFNFESLETAFGLGCMANMFVNCGSLQNISFPKLNTVSYDAFCTDDNGILVAFMFEGCTNLTEIHFKSDMQSTIESCSGYSDKFGAENATIYFDL